VCIRTIRESVRARVTYYIFFGYYCRYVCVLCVGVREEVYVCTYAYVCVCVYVQNFGKYTTMCSPFVSRVGGFRRIGVTTALPSSSVTTDMKIFPFRGS